MNSTFFLSRRWFLSALLMSNFVWSFASSSTSLSSWDDFDDDTPLFDLSGYTVTKGNYKDFASLGFIYDPESNTLTLENITSSILGVEECFEENFGPLTIVLKGESHFEMMYLGTNATLTGDGHLTLQGGWQFDIWPGALHCTKALITGGCTIEVSGWHAIEGQSYTVDGATVMLTGNMNVGEFTLKNCHVASPEGAVFDPQRRTFVLNGQEIESLLITPDENIEIYDLTIAGIPVTSENTTAVAGLPLSGGICYDNTSKTLYLNEASINGAIKWSNAEPLTIALTGRSQANSIETEADLTITNGGILNVGPMNDENIFYLAGFSLHGHTVTVIEGSTLTGSAYREGPRFAKLFHDNDGLPVFVVDNATLALYDSTYDPMFESSNFDTDVKKLTYELTNCHIAKPDDAYYIPEEQRIVRRTSHEPLYMFTIEPGVSPCDLNYDGTVDVDDLNKLVNAMLGHIPQSTHVDVDGNGVIDIDDLNLIVNAIISKNK